MNCRQSPRLGRLRLNNMNSPSFHDLVAALPMTTGCNLIRFDVSSYGESNEFLHTLLLAVLSWNLLHTLTLSGVQWSDNDLCLLARRLPKLKNLVRLDFEWPTKSLVSTDTQVARAIQASPSLLGVNIAGVVPTRVRHAIAFTCSQRQGIRIQTNQEGHPAALWPHILKFHQHDPSVLFLVLQEAYHNSCSLQDGSGMVS
jgi:hypothetical protein